MRAGARAVIDVGGKKSQALSSLSSTDVLGPLAFQDHAYSDASGKFNAGSRFPREGTV